MLKGELVTRPLLEAAGHDARVVPPSVHHTGPTLEIKTALDAFLNEHGYRVAPFTVEAADYAFAAFYERALMRSEQTQADETMAAYLRVPGSDDGIGRGVGVDTFGRDIPQVLLATSIGSTPTRCPSCCGACERAATSS